MHNSVQTQEDMFPATMSLQQFKAQCNKGAQQHIEANKGRTDKNNSNFENSQHAHIKIPICYW